MKHGPNARARSPGLAGLFTVASCNGVCESREQTNIGIVWWAVDALPRMRRDAATKQLAQRRIAAGDAAHTLPDVSVRHP